MKPKRISLWKFLSIATAIVASIATVQIARKAYSPVSDGCYFGECRDPGLGNDITSGPGPNNDFCRLHPAFCQPCNGGDCTDPSFSPPGLCIKIGVLGPCLDRSLFAGLETAEYAFNAPREMAVAEPQSIALVIDTTGTTNFAAELMALPGTPVQSRTPISLIMEAELVGPAFEITPSGRQRRELSKLNPTRWDWEISPKRSGQHQLEVSLYIIAATGGERLGEEKALAERRVINVTVSRLDSLISIVQKLDPLRAFIFALIAGLGGLLAWFGIKGWKDVSSKEPKEEKPRKIEVTIKNEPHKTEGKETDEA